MEIIEDKNSIIVEFSAARKLSENEHRARFIGAFNKSFSLAHKKFKIDRKEISKIEVDNNLNLTFLRLSKKESKFFSYQVDFSELLANLDLLSAAFYESDSFEMKMKISYNLDVIYTIICADPIYFNFFIKTDLS